MNATATAPICRVCGAATTRHLCDTPNEHSRTNPLHHFRCLACGSVFVGDVIDSAELGAAYATLDAKQYYAEIATENRRKMATAVEHLRRMVPTDARVLDVGTGDGLFVEVLRQAGFGDVSAHEIPGADLSRVEGLASHLYRDFDYASVPSAAFDVVTLLDVFEHVPSPRTLLQACARVLRPRGLVYLHTPVVTRLDRLMHLTLRMPGLHRLGRGWQRARTSVFHLENYTPRALRLLLAEAGFDDVRVDVGNELSWPVSRYVRVYLLEKHGLPTALAPVLAPFAWPVVATDLLNANKAVASARRRPDP